MDDNTNIEGFLTDEHCSHGNSGPALKSGQLCSLRSQSVMDIVMEVAK